MNITQQQQQQNRMNEMKEEKSSSSLKPILVWTLHLFSSCSLSHFSLNSLILYLFSRFLLLRIRIRIGSFVCVHIFVSFILNLDTKQCATLACICVGGSMHKLGVISIKMLLHNTLIPPSLN